MPSLKKLHCCGIKELHNIRYSKPRKIIEDIHNDLIRNNKFICAFLIFSDIHKKISGKNLSKYIIKKKLGTITKTKTQENPNTKNSLMVWMWSINEKNLKNYYNKYHEEIIISN